MPLGIEKNTIFTPFKSWFSFTLDQSLALFVNNQFDLVYLKVIIIIMFTLKNLFCSQRYKQDNDIYFSSILISYISSLSLFHDSLVLVVFASSNYYHLTSHDCDFKLLFRNWQIVSIIRQIIWPFVFPRHRYTYLAFLYSTVNTCALQYVTAFAMSAFYSQ